MISTRMRRLRSALVMLLGLLAACGGSASVTTISPVALSVTDVAPSAVSASDRTDDDRKVDPGRHPAEMLSFFRIAPGQRVADLAAAGGYTTELLARAVEG